MIRRLTKHITRKSFPKTKANKIEAQDVKKLLWNLPKILTFALLIC